MNLRTSGCLLILLLVRLILPDVRANDLESAKPSKKKKTNVLMIYTDDHRFSGVHALSNQMVKTPNIDALADDGVAFSNTYLMGAFSAATCVPSRAQLLTGKNLFELTRKGWVLPESDTTMPEHFKANGYETHIVGKWHQDNAALTRSFGSGDRLMSGNLGAYLTDHFRMPMWDFSKEGVYGREKAYLINYDKKGKWIQRPLNDGDKRGPIGTEADGPHSSEVFAQAASDFISKRKKKDPFFMYLAFHAPHDPRQAPKEYLDMYPWEEIELPPSYLSEHPFDNGHLHIRDEKLAPWPRTKEVAKQHLAAYYAIITHLDAQIGKVIKALKASGQYENTLIVLAGDSGLAVGNHGLMGKQNLYNEGGIHVPLIFSGGAVSQSGTRPQLTYIHDIFPSMCELTGVDIPVSVSGKSVVNVINNPQSPGRQYLYHAYMQYQRAYRKGDFKLIEYVKAPAKGKKNAGSRVTQLYNIKEDFWEVKNLVVYPQYQETVDSLRTEMKQVAKQLKDGKEIDGVSVDFWEYYN